MGFGISFPRKCHFGLQTILSWRQSPKDSGRTLYLPLSAEKNLDGGPVPGRGLLPKISAFYIRKTSLHGMANICLPNICYFLSPYEWSFSSLKSQAPYPLFLSFSLYVYKPRLPVWEPHIFGVCSTQKDKIWTCMTEAVNQYHLNKFNKRFKICFFPVNLSYVHLIN